ncbi:MAG TPA: anti-sigma factor antagonist [Nitrospirae bacterium]|nr:anti-sigma factor antagonist [Nitrospirota bacterium]HDZ02450.1 anti-sigma factor antagonist [Nitrospirota bacterium]
MEEFMIDFKIEQSDDKRILTINGELTIQNADALQDILIHSLEYAEHLVLNLENVTDVDLSGLQLLFSACKTTMELKKDFTLNGNCPEVFKEAARDAGYSLHTGCGSGCNKMCLWMVGDDEQKN